MSDTPRGNVLPALAEALAREIDPGEALLWSGMPNPRRYAGRELGLVVLLMCFPGSFVGIFFVGALRVLWDLYALSSPPPHESLVTAWLGVIVCAPLFVLVLLSPLISWKVLVARARNTVYAITSTRVMELRLARGGVARVKSLEPTHPLEVFRKDVPNGEGDLILYPSAANTRAGKLQLVGIASPREVERVLRGAFNPHRA